MFIVKPNGGLGNRMRVINSALHLAHSHDNKNIKLLWSANKVLQADFKDLFKPIKSIQLIKFHFLLFYCILKEKLLNNFANNNPVIYNGYRYFNDENIRDFRFNIAYWKSGGGSLLFNTCHDFYTATGEKNYYHLFQPQLYLQKRIDLICQDFKGKVAGVHIRRTDHVASKENSKTELFITKLDEMFETQAIDMIYLSTDDLHTENQLQQRYANKVISLRDKVLNRNAKKGIEDAVTDMYCLSKTRFILGSYQSTFSEVAAAIGQIPLIIIKA